jgi:hypothetical protein
MGAMADSDANGDVSGGSLSLITPEIRVLRLESGRTSGDYVPGISELEWNLQTTGKVLDRWRVAGKRGINSPDNTEISRTSMARLAGCVQVEGDPWESSPKRQLAAGNEPP